MHRRAMVIARQLPEPLAFASAMVFVAAFLPPEFFGVIAVVSLFGAVTGFGRARVIERWQSRHGGRVVRTGSDLWTAH